MSTQENGKGGFELVTSASLGVIHREIELPIGTILLCIKKKMKILKLKEKFMFSQN
jgi:hypothetical protein